MDFLTPPTDNLYKFLAIAGIAVALSAGFFENRQLAQITENSNQVEGERATQQMIREIDDVEIKREQESYESRMKSNDQRLNDLQKEQAQLNAVQEKVAGKASEVDKSDYKQQSEAFTAKAERLRSDVEQMRSTNGVDAEAENMFKTVRAEVIAMAAIAGKNAVTIELLEQFKVDRKFYDGAILTGICIAAYGFLLWYLKVQRYQDRILVAEAAEKAKQAESESSDVPATVPAPSLPKEVESI